MKSSRMLLCFIITVLIAVSLFAGGCGNSQPDSLKDKVVQKNNTFEINSNKVDFAECFETTDPSISVTVKDDSKFDINKPGTYVVSMLLTKTDDDGENKTEETTDYEFTVYDDEAPKITVDKKALFAYQGEKIDFDGNVIVSDNSEEDISAEVDTSKLKLKRPGTYTVTYSATDSSGNQSTKDIKVKIKKQTFKRLYNIFCKYKETDDTGSHRDKDIWIGGLFENTAFKINKWSTSVYCRISRSNLKSTLRIASFYNSFIYGSGGRIISVTFKSGNSSITIKDKKTKNFGIDIKSHKRINKINDIVKKKKVKMISVTTNGKHTLSLSKKQKKMIQKMIRIYKETKEYGC